MRTLRIAFGECIHILLKASLSGLNEARIDWANMKRGFLFGLGSFLCLGVLAGLVQLSSDVTIAGITVAISVPLSILVILAAHRAPPNRSRGHAVIGWLAGFLIMDAVLLCIFGIVVIFSGPS